MFVSALSPRARPLRLTSIASGFAPGLRGKESQMKIWAVALISMVLVGCATTPVPLRIERLFFLAIARQRPPTAYISIHAAAPSSERIRFP